MAGTSRPFGQQLLLQRAEFARHVVQVAAALLQVLRQVQQSPRRAENDQVFHPLEELACPSRPNS